MKYYYAVKIGKTPGIYNTWEECKAQVLGFKGALFKKFSSKEQAINYLNSNQLEEKNENLTCNSNLEDKKNSKQNNTAIAYVDGSYNKFSKEFSCGVVIFYNGNDPYQKCKSRAKTRCRIYNSRNGCQECIRSGAEHQRKIGGKYAEQQCLFALQPYFAVPDYP